FVAVAVLAAALWSILRGLMRAPHAARRRREARGHQALTHGLLAVGAGDHRAAARHARDARRLVGREPLGLRGLFIEAQRKGDVAAARRHAETALDAAPALPWSARAVLELRCAAGD